MRAEELRKSILQQAIQGKLVKQNPDDEPASVLLERIKAEKERLVKEGKIKKDKTESYIFKGDDNRYYEKIGKNGPIDITDELPFDIPGNWTWTRFPNIVIFKLGKTPERKNKKYWTNSDLPWVSIADLVDYGEIFSTKESISKSALLDCFHNEICPIGTLLMSFKLTIGKTSIAKIDCVHNEGIISVNPIIDEKGKIKKYLFHLLRILVKYVPQTEAIKGSTLNSGKLEKMFIPLPPLEEQERIVKRIEELMPLVDEYSRLEAKDKGLDDKLPGMLKQSILQYAMEGKLVKQNSDDEPASVLLERIKAEKERLIKESKIKRDKNETLIVQNDDKNYYENLPQNWCIEKIGNLLVIERGGSPRPINMYLTNENGINWIKIGDSIKGSKYITQCKEKIKPEGIKHSRFVNKGDFILSNSMSFGRPYILKIDGCIHDGWLVIRKPDKCFYIDFLFYALSSNYIYKQFCASASGAVVSNLNIDKVKNTFIYIPPLNEQKKIANMLETIFAIID